MESEETFVWYLHQCGIDTSETQKKYLAALQRHPEFILSFYAREFPDLYTAWLTKRRLKGDETN